MRPPAETSSSEDHSNPHRVEAKRLARSSPRSFARRAAQPGPPSLAGKSAERSAPSAWTGLSDAGTRSLEAQRERARERRDGAGRARSRKKCPPAHWGLTALRLC